MIRNQQLLQGSWGGRGNSGAIREPAPAPNLSIREPEPVDWGAGVAENQR